MSFKSHFHLVSIGGHPTNERNTKQKRPELMKWHGTPFPWFDAIPLALIDGIKHSREPKHQSDGPIKKQAKLSENTIRESSRSLLTTDNSMLSTVEGATGTAPNSPILSAASSFPNPAESTIEGQALSKVQDESCLTIEGQLIMLDLLANEGLARTYLVIKHDKLRTRWLKLQLERAGADLNISFIDWD